MPDWDENSSLLLDSLDRLLQRLEHEAEARVLPTLESVRQWQIEIMQNLSNPDPKFIGAFRGEPGLKAIEVRVDDSFGVPSMDVAKSLAGFYLELTAMVAELDIMIPRGAAPDIKQINAILELCAWTHAEWIRIHPFANGNGRTARLWANYLALRYNLPPFLRLRPRPGAGYSEAGKRAMHGNWLPTAQVFQKLLTQFFDAASHGHQ